MEKRRDLLTKDKLPLPIEERTLKDAMQLFAKELLPRLGIEEKVVGVARSERIRRTLLVLQKERDNLDETDYRRMGSILFAFAVKFLEKEEVSDLKEAFSMTVLGQMIYKDGIEKGIEQRDKMLIFKWSADGRKPAEIAALLGISEEEVKKVQTEKMMSI